MWKQQLAEGQWTKRMMNEIRVWCKAEYGNKHFCPFVEGFISFQFFKEIKTLLRNAMYTFLSCPLNCLLYFFLLIYFLWDSTPPHSLLDSAQAGALSYSEKKVWGKLEKYVISFACSITFTKCKENIMYFNQSMFFLEIVYNHFVIIIILCNYFIIILRYVIMQKYGIRAKMFEFDPYFSHYLRWKCR